MSTLDGRATQTWWLMDNGHVAESRGYSCAPANPDCWWFPTQRYSTSMVYATREAAVSEARLWIARQRGALDAAEAAL